MSPEHTPSPHAAEPPQETNEESTAGDQIAAPQTDIIATDNEVDGTALDPASHAIRGSLIELGFVNFDGHSGANNTSGAMVAAERRRHFRRDVYVGIRDQEQNLEFLGRIVEGPFHSPHEVSADSAITRTTILHPDRTSFRPSYYVYGSIEILGELVQGRRVIPTPTRPRPYSQIYIFPPDRLRQLLGIEGDFYLGHLMGYEGIEVRTRITEKNFLPRNVGIFGTVGSGKSNTTQVLMEEALTAGWAVVTIDVEGEYVRMNEPTDQGEMTQLLRDKYNLRPLGVRDFQVFVPATGHSEAAAPRQFKVPISELQTEVLADILELSEPQQRMFGTVTAAALRQARPAAPNRRGVLAAAAPVQPARPYTLQILIDGLTEDQNGNYPLLQGNVPGHERATASALRAKLIHLGRSGVLDWNATSAVPELPIEELLVGGRLSVLDVSETDDRSRNIAIAYTLEALFERVIQTAEGMQMPNGSLRPRILVVIEEVHTFVSRATAGKMKSVLDNLQIISRRGRKRWMALALVSQQPGHVPDELFELANTRFIHQLKSAANLAPVKQTTGGVHEALWSILPALGPGQCLVSGAVFRNPLFVDIRPACSRRLLTT